MVELNLVAALVTLLSCIMSVIFSGDKYDIWDSALAVLAIYVCIKLRKEFSQNESSFLMARISFGVAIMIMLMTILTAIKESAALMMNNKFWKVFDGEFIAAIMLTWAIGFFYRKEKKFIQRQQANQRFSNA